jgi:zinc transport system ATP-binding protein
MMNDKRASQPLSLRFSGVSFSYGRLKVLENVSFHLHRGEFVALVGPNGSGKTTALKLILGLEKPRAGRVELFGEGTPGYVPQQAVFDPVFPIAVEDVVRMGRLRPLSRGYTAADRAAVMEALEELGIAALARRPYGALSGGQRRRVLAARALAAKPAFLILDEPTANMDRESEERLSRVLEGLKGKTTILIVTHNPELVSPLTDRALCLGNGEGGPAHGIVRHPVENSGPSGHVLHGERLPADRCFEGEEP